MNTTGAAAGFCVAGFCATGFAATAGMIATASLMVRPPGRVRFSGTSRKPHRALLSASMGSGGFGQAPGTNPGGVRPGPAVRAGADEELPADADEALLGIGTNAARQARAAAAVTARMLCFGM
ncbi:hypothetical protein AB0G83_05255 [Streptomyces klenkii]|uniref:hypothetical protein n=1 Tax=Streptomyces klenkii TaxID=1420899 RepID=UPI0033D07A16